MLAPAETSLDKIKAVIVTEPEESCEEPEEPEVLQLSGNTEDQGDGWGVRVFRWSALDRDESYTFELRDTEDEQKVYYRRRIDLPNLRNTYNLEVLTLRLEPNFLETGEPEDDMGGVDLGSYDRRGIDAWQAAEENYTGPENPNDPGGYPPPNADGDLCFNQSRSPVVDQIENLGGNLKRVSILARAGMLPPGELLVVNGINAQSVAWPEGQYVPDERDGWGTIILYHVYPGSVYVVRNGSGAETQRAVLDSYLPPGASWQLTGSVYCAYAVIGTPHPGLGNDKNTAPPLDELPLVPANFDPDLKPNGQWDFTKLITPEFVENLKRLKADLNTDNEKKFHRIPYFSGIQAFDDVEFADDDGVGYRYSSWAWEGNYRRSRNNKFKLDKDWRLLSYYNELKGVRSVHFDRDVGLQIDEPFSGNPGVAVKNNVGLWAMWRENRQKRYTVPIKEGREGGQANGQIKDPSFMGDLEAVRVLGTLASIEGDEQFKKAEVDYTKIKAEFQELYKKDIPYYLANDINKPQWKRFMFFAMGEVATALKRNTTVFAHSGGGAPVGFILRLLSVHPDTRKLIQEWTEANKNNAAFKYRIRGQEAVLSVQAENLLKAGAYGPVKFDLKNHYTTSQIFRTANEGDTWKNTIKVEIDRIGQTPLASKDIRYFKTASKITHIHMARMALKYGEYKNPRPNDQLID